MRFGAFDPVKENNSAQKQASLSAKLASKLLYLSWAAQEQALDQVQALEAAHDATSADIHQKCV